MPGWTPPTKKTVLLSLIFVLLGIFIGIAGFLNAVGQYSQLCVYIGFGLTFLSWFILFLGVKFEGI